MILAGSVGGQSGSVDGTGLAARFLRPTGVATDGEGNLFVADSGNNTIRKISASGLVTTLAGKAGAFVSVDGTGSAAQFRRPEAVAVDGDGNVYVGDSNNYTIRKITPAGVVTTLAGGGPDHGSVDGVGNRARFDFPTGLARATDGSLFVADNYTIRKVSPAGVVL